jgi:hypothetical protein
MPTPGSTNWPTLVDTYTQSVAADGDQLDSPVPHDRQHGDHYKREEALQQNLGVEPHLIDGTVAVDTIPETVKEKTDIAFRRIADIIGAAWDATIPGTLAYFLGRFDGSTGHTHNGLTGNGPIIPTTGAAGGDLSGTYPNPVVDSIQGVAVDPTAPTAGQTLTYDGSAWTHTLVLTNPMTTQDDLVVGGAAGIPTRLGKGTDGQVLTVDPATHHLFWATPSTGTGGGTGDLVDPTTTKGDLIVRGSQGADRALGSAIESNEGGTLSNLVDGNDATRFDGDTTAIPASYFRFDLGAAYPINGWRIRQMAPTDGWFMSQYKWQYSTDDATYVDAVTHTAVVQDETVAMPAEHTARYWKLVGIASVNPAAAWLAYTVSLFQRVAPTRIAVGTNGQVLTADSAQAVGVGWKDELQTLNFVIDGGSTPITVGEKGHLRVDYACVIQSVALLADQSGSIVVDIWKDTYANFPPTSGDTITASARPTLSGAQKSQDATLTGWTTAIAAGDILAFNVVSAATLTRVTLALKVKRA